MLMSAAIPAPTIAGSSRSKAPVVLTSTDSAAANAVYGNDPTELLQPPPLATGGAGDHSAVYQFLMAVFQGPSRDSFLAGLDDPFYEPRDRLLVKQGPRILGHVHLTSRVMHFG